MVNFGHFYMLKGSNISNGHMVAEYTWRIPLPILGWQGNNHLCSHQPTVELAVSVMKDISANNKQSRVC